MEVEGSEVFPLITHPSVSISFHTHNGRTYRNRRCLPVARIAESPGHHDSFADETFERGSTDLLIGMRELLKREASMRIAPAMLNGTSS